MVAGDDERGTPQKGPAMAAALARQEQLNGDTPSVAFERTPSFCCVGPGQGQALAAEILRSG